MNRQAAKLKKTPASPRPALTNPRPQRPLPVPAEPTHPRLRPGKFVCARAHARVRAPGGQLRNGLLAAARHNGGGWNNARFVRAGSCFPPASPPSLWPYGTLIPATAQHKCTCVLRVTRGRAGGTDPLQTQTPPPVAPSSFLRTAPLSTPATTSIPGVGHRAGLEASGPAGHFYFPRRRRTPLPLPPPSRASARAHTHTRTHTPSLFLSLSLPLFPSLSHYLFISLFGGPQAPHLLPSLSSPWPARPRPVLRTPANNSKCQQIPCGECLTRPR